MNAYVEVGRRASRSRVREVPLLMSPLARRRLQCYLALVVGDIAALFVGFASAGYLYLGSDGISWAMLLAQLVLPVSITVALLNGSYSIAALTRPGHGLWRASLAQASSCAAVQFIAFYTRSSVDFSRAILTIGTVLSFLMLVWTRLQMRGFVRWRCGAHVVNELIIDDGGPTVNLATTCRISAEMFKLSPSLDDPHALDRIGLVMRNADRVIVSCPPERRHAWSLVLKGANVAGEVLDDTVAELGARGARTAGGHGLLEVSAGPLGLRQRAIKRAFDAAVAGVLLVALSPLLIAVAIAIVLDDGGPVFFVQRRLGRGNRFFDMYKFRSMRAERADPDGRTSAIRDDRRVTRVGRLIRSTSIDELPQLINVLLGTMSLAGPRPHAIGSQAGDRLFWEVDHRYWTRHALKPGITGLAQVRGWRGATHSEDDLTGRIDADLEYLWRWSLARDLRILLGTMRVLVHDRAF